jgi:hypothetical protein
MTLLDAALSYAARGWPVFPLHSIRGGHCSCRDGAGCSRPGKHPRTPHGRTEATTDPERVRRFWRCWPDANIGIATGLESGILVVDLDDPHAVDEIRLPDSPCSVTGRGGRHVLYRRPPGGRYLTATRVLGPELAVDSRADGGYIVAPPSVHLSGRAYTWDLDPAETPLADAPAWWLDAIRREEITAIPLPARDDDDELPPDIEALLSAIPADEYTVWRNVGLALAHADPAGGLAWWDWWSSRSPKYDPASVRSQWRKMVRRGPVANPITLHSIRQLACDLGYEDPLLRAGAEIAAALMESEQARIAAALVAAPSSTSVEQPPDLIPQTGLLGELVLWILETSIRPQPELAVAAAAAFLGAVYGRRYRTTTDLRTNLYLVGVAPSGSGKDHARKCIDRLACEGMATQYLGGSKIASGPGLVSALRRFPSQLFMIDEFGIYLAALTGQAAAAHHRDLMATMMELYSSASVTYRGTEYADAEKRPRVELIQPNACIYGTTTPDQFYGALTSMQGLDGSLARFLVVHAPDDPPPRARVDCAPPPRELVDSVRALVDRPPPGGNLAGAGGSKVNTIVPTVAPMDPAVQDAWELLDEQARGLATDAGGRAIYARTAENAAKLALVAAVSRNPDVPIIGPEEFRWGREFALWSSNRLVAEVGRRVADSQAERDTKRVAEIVRGAGKAGIRRNDLVRRTFFLRAREREEVLSTLLQAGLVVEQKDAVTGPGRPATTYRHVEA